MINLTRAPTKVSTDARTSSTNWLYRRYGAVGKDVVHHAGLLLTLLLASVGVLYLPWLWEVARGNLGTQVGDTAPQMYLVMLTTTAYLVGLVLSYEETENNNYSLLDALPARAVRHLVYKAAAGAILLVTWLLAAGLLMGVLSGNGVTLITGLFTDSPQIISVINFGRSGLITFLQVAAIFMTGLLMGLIFTTLSAAAVVGLFLYGLFLFGVSRFLENHGHLANVVSTSGLLVWIAACSALYAPATIYSRTRNRSAAAEARGVSTDVSKGMYLHLAGLAFDPPNRHLLRVPTVLALLATPFLMVVPQLDAGILVLALFPPAAALLGACAWHTSERQAARFLTYALPVRRTQLFWPRMGALTIASLLFGLAVPLFRMIGIYLQSDRPVMEELLVDGLHPMFITATLGTVATAFLGALFRLFFRSMIIAAVLASMVMVCWAPTAVLSIHQVAIWSGESLGGDTIIHGSWCAAVSLGLPLLCLWVTYCRTRLLELPDARRGRIAVALFLLLAIWGAFLLATPTTHLIVLIFG